MVTLVGTPNTTVSNLRWSVIEPDIVSDDWLYLQREFSVNIGANGTGTFTGSFILWAAADRDVGGVDQFSGESSPDPIYVYIQNSSAFNSLICRSNTITVRSS